MSTAKQQPPRAWPSLDAIERDIEARRLAAARQQLATNTRAQEARDALFGPDPHLGLNRRPMW